MARGKRLPKDQPFSGFASSRFDLDRDSDGELIAIFTLNSPHKRRPLRPDPVPHFDERDKAEVCRTKAKEIAALERNPFLHLQSAPARMGFNLSALIRWTEIWKKNGEGIRGPLAAARFLRDAGAVDNTPEKHYLLGPVVEINHGVISRSQLTL